MSGDAGLENRSNPDDDLDLAIVSARRRLRTAFWSQSIIYFLMRRGRHGDGWGPLKTRTWMICS